MTEQYGERFNVFGLYINALKRISYKSKIGGGVNLVYDQSDAYILEWSGEDVKNNIETLKPGISAAYELVISKISFMFNFGFYLYTMEKSEGQTFQCLTLKYYFVDDVFAEVVLNTNWGKAEYVGFGLGYKLNFIYKRKIMH